MPGVPGEIGGQPVREVDARARCPKDEIQRGDDEKSDREAGTDPCQDAPSAIKGTSPPQRGDGEHEPADPLNSAEDGEEGSESVAHEMGVRSQESGIRGCQG